MIRSLYSALTSKEHRHGGPWDRGAADSYYHRRPDPHYYLGDTMASPRITDLTEEEHTDYMAGYYYNEKQGHKKEW